MIQVIQESISTRNQEKYAYVFRHMTECIILYNNHLPDRIFCGFFREKFINCTDEGTAIQYIFYYSPLHRLLVPQSKPTLVLLWTRTYSQRWWSWFWEPCFTNKFLLWIIKVVRHHGFIGEENNKSDALSYPKQMYEVLFFVLQLLLVFKSVNVASSRYFDIRFLINHLLCCGKWSFFIVIIDRL